MILISLLSLFSLVVGVLGYLGAHSHTTSPIFGIYVVGTALGVLAFCGLISLLFLFRKGSRTSKLGILFGLPALTAVGGLAYLWFTNPMPSDVTTNSLRPPPFKRRLFLIQPLSGAENLDADFEVKRPYDSANSALQTQSTTPVEGFSVNLPAAEVFPLAAEVLRRDFPEWKLVSFDPDSLTIEAETELEAFRLMNDLALSFVPAKVSEFQTRVDVRMRMRDVPVDFGLNLHRLSEFLDKFSSALRGAAQIRITAKKAKEEKANPPTPVPAPAPVSPEGGTPPPAPAPAPTPPTAATPSTGAPVTAPPAPEKAK